jgi:hypothetical protein
MYEIRRGAQSVARVQGLDDKDSDGNYVNFPHDTDVQEGDVLVVVATGEEHPVLRVRPIVQGTDIMSKHAYY